MTRAIYDEALLRGESYENLRQLCKNIGPRLSGSDNAEKSVKYMEEKMAKHIINMRKWGGLLIAAGALLPLPFAIAAMAAGMIRFDFRNFLIFALLRFLRFVIYGFAIYQMLN